MFAAHFLTSLVSVPACAYRSSISRVSGRSYTGRRPPAVAWRGGVLRRPAEAVGVLAAHRDAVVARGEALDDRVHLVVELRARDRERGELAVARARRRDEAEPVSYTHLTLPTILRV